MRSISTLKLRLNKTFHIGTNQGGFSLIELAVVVAIIGILAAVAIPVMLGQRQGAQDKDSQSALRDITTQGRAAAANNNMAFPGGNSSAYADLLDADEPAIAVGDEKAGVNNAAGNATEVSTSWESTTVAIYTDLSDSGDCWIVVDDLNNGTTYGVIENEPNCNAAAITAGDITSTNFAGAASSPTPSAATVAQNNLNTAMAAAQSIYTANANNFAAITAASMTAAGTGLTYTDLVTLPDAYNYTIAATQSVGTISVYTYFTEMNWYTRSLYLSTLSADGKVYSMFFDDSGPMQYGAENNAAEYVPTLDSDETYSWFTSWATGSFSAVDSAAAADQAAQDDLMTALPGISQVVGGNHVTVRAADLAVLYPTLTFMDLVDLGSLPADLVANTVVTGTVFVYDEGPYWGGTLVTASTTGRIFAVRHSIPNNVERGAELDVFGPGLTAGDTAVDGLDWMYWRSGGF